MYVASNGHQYYDIANKDVVDTFFGTMGTAWFYGVDTENERIFLPRNNFFDQLTGDTTEVGQSVEAGLPNIKGTAQFGDSNNGGTGESTLGGVSLHRDSDNLWYRDTEWALGKNIRAGNESDDGNYSYGIKEQLIFPEIEYDKVDKVRGMDIIFVTTAKTDEEARELLTLFGMPFSK